MTALIEYGPTVVVLRDHDQNPLPRRTTHTMGNDKAKFAVYRNDNPGPKYVMAFICTCGEPVVGYGDDKKGTFVGTCGKGHSTTVFAS